MPKEPLVTRKEYSGSAQAFSLNQAKAIERLRAAARHLGAAFPEIAEVHLFGSLARGEAMPSSDADVLLVLDASDVPFVDRALRYRIEDVGIGVDLLAYTREEIDRMLAQGNPFLRRALSEGLLLWQR